MSDLAEAAKATRDSLELAISRNSRRRHIWLIYWDNEICCATATLRTFFLLTIHKSCGWKAIFSGADKVGGCLHRMLWRTKMSCLQSVQQICGSFCGADFYRSPRYFSVFSTSSLCYKVVEEFCGFLLLFEVWLLTNRRQTSMKGTFDKVKKHSTLARSTRHKIPIKCS